VHTVVYLDTSPLPNGTAIAEVQSPEQREHQQRAVQEHGDGWRWPVPDRETLTAGTYGSTSGLSEEHLRLIALRATPHPYATMISPVHLAHDRPPGIRRAAIFCAAGGIDVARLRELIAQGAPRRSPTATGSYTTSPPGTGRCSPYPINSPTCCTTSPKSDPRPERKDG
jgi:hypothetical protein